jgi:hypothetical protein
MSGILAALAGIKTAIATAVDEYFNRTTLLLNTSSTNGAQNNTFLDSSTNNFTITRNGNTTQGTFTPFSQTGWGNYFNGSSSLQFTSNAALSPGTGDFTLEFWYLGASNTGPLFATTTSGALFVGELPGGVFGLRAFGVANICSTSTFPTANQWTHIAITRSGTTCRLFYNGVLQQTSTSSQDFVQGTSYIATEGSGGFATGYISNFRLVKGTAVYTAAFTTPTAPLTAITNTSLLTCQDNRFKDNSTNAFAITLNGSPSVQAFSPFAPTAAYDAAVVGGSGYFDGSGDYLTFTDSSNALDIGSVNVSCEAWVYSTASVTGGCIVVGKYGGSSTWNSTNGWEWILAVSATNFPNLQYYTSGTSLNTITSSKALALNSWNHLAIATDTSTNISLFLNGERVATTTGTVGKPTTRTSMLVAGPNSNLWTGYLSGMRFLSGSNAYSASSSSITVPTASPTSISGTALLLNYTNAGIFDSAAKNVLETVGNAQVSTTQAKWGTTSMYFDGTGDYLTIPNSPTIAVGSGDFAIECWWYPTDLSASSNVWCLGDSRSANNGLLLYWSSGSGKLILYSNGAALITSSINTTTNAWYYINVVRSGSGSNNLTLYIDGSSAGTATNTTSFAGVAANGFAVCAEYAGSFGAGKAAYFDDFRITKGYARPSTSPTAAFPLQ